MVFQLPDPSLNSRDGRIGDVLVVAPEAQSGMGHAITTNSTLYLNKISKENDVIEEYSCSGTPVDCVKLAVNEI
jgi:5'-nucleotidase